MNDTLFSLVNIQTSIYQKPLSFFSRNRSCLFNMVEAKSRQLGMLNKSLIG